MQIRVLVSVASMSRKSFPISCRDLCRIRIRINSRQTRRNRKAQEVKDR